MCPLETVAAPRTDHPAAEWATLAYSIHPEIRLPPGLFEAFLVHHVGDEPRTAENPPPNLGDLYVAFAYGQGNQAAQEHLERCHFARIERRLSRMNIPSATCSDILQTLRCHLVEFSGNARQGLTYSGRGSLGGWLFISAVRQAERRGQLARREQLTPEAAEPTHQAMLPAPDPEMEHLISSYRATFEQAIRDGLTQLTSRERNLLRLHFLDRLSIDRLAEVYGVHRATTARWLVRAQQRLGEATRSYFLASIPIGQASFPRLLALIQSKLNLDLSQILQAAVPSEA